MKGNIINKTRPPKLADIINIVNKVADPEIPVITLAELGVIRDVSIGDKNSITVTITPTYANCPAMSTIERTIVDAVVSAGYLKPTIEKKSSPAWTSDWISMATRKKLQDFGIAPPNGRAAESGNGGEPHICPNCKNIDVRLISAFGSTPCKSLYQCNDCLEPFEYFKCH